MSKSIVYIAFISADHIGVIKKIDNQVSIWKSLGYSVTIVFDVTTKSTLIKYAARYLTLFRYFILHKQPSSTIYLRQTPSCHFTHLCLGTENFHVRSMQM